MSTEETIYRPGLEGVVAGETEICSVEQGGLWYRGYGIQDLAEHASFEECAFLLLHGKLPTSNELQMFRSFLDGHRQLPGPVVDAIRGIPRHAEPMDVLRSAVSMYGHFDTTRGSSRDAMICQATGILAAVPSIIAARLRLLDGKEIVEPEEGLSHAAQFLHMAFGRAPSDLEARILNLTLILYAEHEFNASTFAARVCTSTLSDLYSSVVAAIGTLKGPLHGGANEEAIKLIQRFSSADEAREWTEDALRRKVKIMGFGHRVYKNGDHRAHILENHIEDLARARNELWRVAVYHAIKNTVWEQKQLYPNLDFPCGLIYHLLGLPIDIYTPLFVASRVSGWCAHIIEQRENNRIIRPRSRYIGPKPRTWVPIDVR